MEAKGKATLTYDDGKTLELPVYGGTIGPDVIDIRALYGKTGKFTYDPGFLSTASLQLEDHLHRRRRGRSHVPRLPDRAAGPALRLPRGLLPAAQRRAAEGGAEEGIRPHRHRAHDGARAARAPLPGLPPRLAPDGGDGGRGGRALGLLPRLARHQQRRAPRDLGLPPHREAADHRRHGLQVQHGPALHVPEEQPRLHLELHAHDVRRAGRGLRGEPGPRARARPHPHPARRPRAERLHLHRAARRLLGREPVRLHRLRHRLPLGAGARRRQRGGAADAHGHPEGRRRRQARRVREEGEGQELRREADGLRPPRVQELRPARQAHAGDLPRGARRAGPARRPALQARHGAGEGGARGRVLRLPQALPERRLLLGHRAARAGHPGLHVHLHLLARAHGGLDRAVERDDLGSRS